MLMMKYFFIFLFLTFGGVAFSQNIYNSPYSIYGLGITNDRMSTLNRGMGGTGIAVRDGFNLNYLNPASYGSIASPVSSVFEMGFYVERNDYRTTDLSESRTNGSLSNINYWFKFLPQWSSTVGLTPFSSVSYKINTTRQLGGISEVDYRYEGDGTISRLYWGNGFSIGKNLSLGLNISYIFGTISRRESVNTLNQASTLTYENRINTNKFDWDAGLQYEVHLKKDKSLVMGVIGDTESTFQGNQKNYLLDGPLDTLRTSKGEKLSYKIPQSYGFGLALQTSRSIVAADLKFDHWNAVNNEHQNVTFLDVWKFSMGYMNRGNPDAISYLGAVSFRAGFHVQRYPLKIKDINLPWWGLSAGISMPMFDNRSSINISYSFDSLGTTQHGLILQQSQHIMFDVVIRDLWGVRRKFD
jgi:hypothetical protein